MVIVFPHHNGLPYKRALKMLTAEFLQRIIQNGTGQSQALLPSLLPSSISPPIYSLPPLIFSLPFLLSSVPDSHHDSVEDACVWMELMLWMLKAYMQKTGRSVSYEK